MYNLQTTNRFGFLDDEEEHDENVNTTKTPQPKPAATESKKDNKKEPANKKGNAASQGPKNEKANSGPSARGDGPRGNSQQAKPSTGFGAPSASVANDDKFGSGGGGNLFGGERRPPRAQGQGNTGGFGGTGGGRPFGTPALSNVGNRPAGGGGSGGGGAPFDNRGKREFDRKSGSEKSGVKASEKRDGQGPHNWGNEIKDFNNEKLAAQEDNENEEHKTPANADDKEEAGEAVTVPEEPNVIGLEEYLSKKQQSKPEKTVQLRKAGEGEGAFNAPKLGRKIKADKSDDNETVVIITGKSGRVKNRIDVDLQPIANRGGRGGMRGGGGRGRGGRGGEFGRDHQQQQPIVLDESAFPALPSDSKQPAKVF